MTIRRSMLGVLLAIVLLTSSASASLAQPTAPGASPAPAAAPGSMLIVENAGQWPAAARFQIWNSPIGAGVTWLAGDSIWLVVAGSTSHVASSEGSADPLADLPPAALQPTTLRALKLTFPDSNPDVRIEAFRPAETVVSYFIGNDPAQWRPSVPVWHGVRYVDLYPGIDLVLGGQGDEWRLEAAPGAAVEAINLHLEGAALVGSEHTKLWLEAEGELLSMLLPSASFPYRATIHSPDGDAHAITMTPRPAPGQLRHPADNPAALLYSTYLGGALADWAEDLAVDAGGNSYVAGTTFSSNFPTTPGALDPDLGGSHDLFVAKLNPTGDMLVYATFLGGNDRETSGSLTVDSQGNVFVTGDTGSSDFPVTPGAFDASFNGESDGFVAKLGPGGNSLAFSTYFGGTLEDYGSAIAVDGTGKTYVTGTTSSSNFPTTAGAFDTTFRGWDDAFALALGAAGDALVYATYLGGSNIDLGTGIAVDAAGQARVAGVTLSSDFPTTPGAFDRERSGWDVFALSLDPSGSALSFATFVGGSGHETTPVAVALDAMGFVYLAGNTTSLDFPVTPGAWSTSHSGGQKDAFAAKLNPTGSALAFSTYLGGSEDDWANVIAVDGSGHAYVAGGTKSSDFPTTPGAFDRQFNGGECYGTPCRDGFLARLNLDGSSLLAATYLGGGDADSVRGLAVDQTGHALVAGETSSQGFPTTPGAFDPSYNGGNYIGGDAFVAKLVLQRYNQVWLPIVTRR